jgi:hypothetical protein
LASAEIPSKKFAAAHSTVRRIQDWLNGGFKTHFDQDPLEVYPDYESKYFTLSAQPAAAEGRNLDALAFYHQVIINPYYRRK